MGHPSTMVITTEEMLIYVYVRKKKKKKTKGFKKNHLFWNASERSRGKPVWWYLRVSVSSDISFQPAEGLNLSDICVGCASFQPPKTELLAEKICPSRMYWEYLWLTQEHKSLQWEARGSSATWLWVEMVKVWQLCYSLRVFSLGDFHCLHEISVPTVLSVGSLFWLQSDYIYACDNAGW